MWFLAVAYPVLVHLAVIWPWPRLEWLALQLRVRAESHFARHPLEAES